MLHWAKIAVLAAIAFFAPIGELVAGTAFLVAVDAVTGLLAARKARKKITSFRFARSLSKLAVYWTVIMLGHVIHVIFAPKFVLLGLISTFIAAAEGLSILENLNKLSHNTLIDRLIDALKAKSSKDDDDKTH